MAGETAGRRRDEAGVADVPFKHLTVDNAREYVRLGESGGHDAVWGKLSHEAHEELMALALYGQSTGSFNYHWHLDQIEAGSTPTCSPAAVQRGLDKLGLGPER